MEISKIDQKTKKIVKIFQFLSNRVHTQPLYALCGCGETRAERKLLRAIGDCGQKVERGKDPDLRTGCGLSVVSVDGKKTRPGGNVADKQLPSSDLVALLYL